jgi:hypothetical protein
MLLRLYAANLERESRSATEEAARDAIGQLGFMLVIPLAMFFVIAVRQWFPDVTQRWGIDAE